MNLKRVIEIVKPNTSENGLLIINNSFRVNDNHALEFMMNEIAPSNITIVLLIPQEDNPRNRDFFLEGIKNYNDVLSSYTNQVFLVDKLDYDELVQFDIIVSDMVFLRERKRIIDSIVPICKDNQIGLFMIETNTIVPVTVTSNKEEYAARTIRRKIWNQLPLFIDSNDHYQTLFHYEEKALRELQHFIQFKLNDYDKRNDPSMDYQSNLSIYLKYGFISPLTIYHYMMEQESAYLDKFLDELIIRRELAYNFVYYNEKYDQFDSMTYPWAYETMDLHLFDEREYLYTTEDYIHFKTHDKYFNAAMKELVITGKMHGYMRMYWAKKIIEWSPSYEVAYHTILTLNNYYFYDGFTPNSYAGVAWCFGKHDRAFKQRLVFGKIRYMSQNGLKRKFNIDQYVLRIEEGMKK